MPAPIYMPQKEDMVSQMLMQMFMQKYQHGLQSKTALALQAQQKQKLDEDRLYKEKEWDRQQTIQADQGRIEKERAAALDMVKFGIEKKIELQQAGSTQLPRGTGTSSTPQIQLPGGQGEMTIPPKSKNITQMQTDEGIMFVDTKSGAVTPSGYKAPEKKGPQPTKTSLTMAALKGNKEAADVLKKMSDDAIAQAGDSAVAQVTAKLSVFDVDAIARKIVAGEELIDNVKNTFGVPVQEYVRGRVLKMDPEYNFVAPRVRASAIKSSMLQQEKQFGAAGSFVRNINKQITRVEEIGNDIVTRFGVRIYDLPRRELLRSVKGSGHENVMEAYMKEISTEILKLSSGSAASVALPPEANREQWEKIHDANLSMKELLIVLNETRDMANMRIESFRENIEFSMARLKNVRNGRVSVDMNPNVPGISGEDEALINKYMR